MSKKITYYPLNNKEFSKKIFDLVSQDTNDLITLMNDGADFQTEASAEVIFSFAFRILAGKIGGK